jgi:DNA-binding SARP family transcriptional activator
VLIRLLGPVEVERSGQSLPVRPPQVALTLAALAWHVGRVVSVESLLARVWGEAVPPGARRTLYTIITRIRRDVLADDGAVVHRLGGYLLDVDESAVDVSRFRNLADLGFPSPGLGVRGRLPSHASRTIVMAAAVGSTMSSRHRHGSQRFHRCGCFTPNTNDATPKTGMLLWHVSASR